LTKHHSISPEATWRVEKATRELASEYLERIAVGVREKGVPVRVITVEGNPHGGIVFCAEAEQVDLIVICTRGQSGISRWLIGSVADRVMRGARVPVLLVSARQEEEKICSLNKNIGQSPLNLETNMESQSGKKTRLM
jgi:nucleotide-binding universal stress UspA family protein